MNSVVLIALVLLVVIVLVAFGWGLQALVKANRQVTDRALVSLRGEFAALAAELLDVKTNDLSRKNVEQVRPLFDQIKEQLTAAKAATDAARKENAALGARIETKMEAVGDKAAGLGKAAEDFVTALKGGNKIQGNWGEGILDQALTDAGLVKGVNYFVQTGPQEGGLPDVTVLCGAHKKMIIDAKVNISDFMEAANVAKAGQEKLAEQLMKKHAESVRRQIKGLAEREYPKRLHAKDPDYEYSSLVLMFMPSEATYAAAVIADSTIVSYAHSLNVLLCSPSTLFGYLASVKYGLDCIDTIKNHQKIIDNAHLIVDRMDAALKMLDDVGKSLDAAKAKYQAALGKLGDGSNPQNVLVPANRLAQLSKYQGET